MIEETFQHKASSRGTSAEPENPMRQDGPGCVKMTNAAPDARPGAYALLLTTKVVAEPVRIGQRHWLPLPVPGWAVYVGSAWGRGGVRARLAHHRRRAIRPHWHIDYLRDYSQIETVWFSHDPRRCECLWAAVLAGWPGSMAPTFRFGASDCHCPAHFYQFRDRPALATFITALRARCPDHAAVSEWIPD